MRLINQDNGQTQNSDEGETLMSQFAASTNNEPRAARRSRVGATAVVMTALFGMVGCDTLLDVDLPGTLPAENLRLPSNAPLLANSVQSQFECFFANYVGAKAVWTDEAVSGSQRAGRQFWMTRQEGPIANRGSGSCETTTEGNAWADLYTHYNTYGLGRDVVSWLEEWTDEEVPGRMQLLATSRAYTAYAIMLGGQTFCAGMVLEPSGDIVRPVQVMETARQWWDQTLTEAGAAGDDQLQNLARVGLARTELWLGNLDAAAQHAEQVAAGFRFDATYADHPNRENHVTTEFRRDNHQTVYPGLTGLDTEVDGVADPRVAMNDRNTLTIDGRTPGWAPAKYSSTSSPIRMASWEEAQLIIAEARLGQEAVDRINTLRAQHGLPTYTPDNVNDDDEILDQVLEERRRELWIEGHRINDFLRHFDRPSIRDAWPEGQTHDGDPIQERYCFWFPEREVDANPNISPSDIPSLAENGMHPSIMRSF